MITLFLRYPLPAVLFCVIATLAALAGLPKLKFDDGLRAAFKSDYAEFQRFEEFRRLFSLTGTDIALHLSADDFTVPERLQAVRELLLELGLLEEVTARTSIFDLRTVPTEEDNGTPIVPDDLTSRSANSEALSAAAAHPLNGNRMITADRRHLLIGIQLATDDQTRVAASLSEIDALAHSVLAEIGVTHALAGVPVLRARVIEDITRDQVIINVVGAGLGLLLTLIMFRRLLPAVNAGLPAVIALIWVLGFLGHSGIGINTLTNSLPVLIMVLAFADSMHLTFEVQRGKQGGLTGRDAVEKALRIAAPPCFLTSLTTAIAFASLLISQSELIRAFAVAGLIAVAITFLAVVMINPLIALGVSQVAGRIGRREAPVQPLLFPVRLWERCLNAMLAKPLPATAFGAMMFVGGVALYSQIQPHFIILENVNASARELAAHNEVEERFAPLSTLDLTLVPATSDAAYSEQAFEGVREVHMALSERFGADRIVSAWNAAEWLRPEAPERAGPAVARMLQEDAEESARNFIAGNGDAYRIALLTPGLSSSETIALTDIVEETIDPARSASGLSVESDGLQVMSAAVAPRMISELNISFLAAAALSGLIIGIWCRRFWIGCIALLINVLPIMLAGAWLSASGQGLQFASGLALTIAFGIAVDDTIHVLNRLRPALRDGRQLTRDDLHAAFMTITPVLFATTLILVGGLASALLSAIPTINLFAGLSMGVLVVALVADILILPAVLSLFVTPRKRETVR